jgi:thiol-disulfide isomerase/thioredoxin
MKLQYLLGSLILLICLLGGFAWWETQQYQATKQLPLIWRTEFVDLAGKAQMLPNRGKPVVINFWASWCGPCQEEVPILSAFAQQYRGKIAVIGIAVDNVHAVQQFLAKIPSHYPILLGNADVLALMKAEGNHIGGLPFTIVYTANGQKIMAKAGKIEANEFEQIAQQVLS